MKVMKTFNPERELYKTNDCSHNCFVFDCINNNDCSGAGDGINFDSGACHMFDFRNTASPLKREAFGSGCGIAPSYGKIDGIGNSYCNSNGSCNEHGIGRIYDCGIFYEASYARRSFFGRSS